MRSIRFSVVLPALLLTLASTGWSEDLEGAVKQLAGESAKRYVAPIVSGIGADMNAGWFHKSPPADKFKFFLEGGMVLMGSFLGEGETHFNVNQSFRLTREQADSLIGTNVPAGSIRDSMINTLISRNFDMRITGPTVIGPKNENARIIFPLTDSIFPGAPVIPGDTIDLPVTGVLEDFTQYPIPLFAPQFTFGTVFGTNVILRWLPTVPLGDMGDFKYFGFGLQHNPQVWMGSKLPVDVAVSLFMQKVEFGSLMEASTFALGLNTSKTFGWRLLNATPYAGFALESSKMVFSYSRQIDLPTGPSTQGIDFELKGDNHTRLTLGLSVRLLIMNINADYNLAKYPSFSLGLMFGY